MQLLIIHPRTNSFRKSLLEHIKAAYNSKFRRCLSSEFVIESQVYGEGLSVERGGEALVWCVDRGKEIVHLTVHASFDLIEPEV